MNAAGHTRLLLIGGTSEIGLAIVRRLAADGPTQPYLLGRDKNRTDAALAQLTRDGCIDAHSGELDALEPHTHAAAIANAFERAGGFDIVVLAVGVLGAQQGLDADPTETETVMRTNFDGCGSLLI